MIFYVYQAGAYLHNDPISTLLQCLNLIIYGSFVNSKSLSLQFIYIVNLEILNLSKRWKKLSLIRVLALKSLDN